MTVDRRGEGNFIEREPHDTVLPKTPTGICCNTDSLLGIEVSANHLALNKAVTAWQVHIAL